MQWRSWITLGLALGGLLLSSPASAQPATTPTDEWDTHRWPGRTTIGVGAGLPFLAGISGSIEANVFATRRVLLSGSFHPAVAFVGGAGGGVTIVSWMAGGGARWLLGDTFFLSGSLLYRSEKTEWFSEYNGQGTTNQELLELGVSLGNRWDHERWFVSVDWVALNAPLKTLSKEVRIHAPGPEGTTPYDAGVELRFVHTTVGRVFLWLDNSARQVR